MTIQRISYRKDYGNPWRWVTVAASEAILSSPKHILRRAIDQNGVWFFFVFSLHAAHNRQN